MNSKRSPGRKRRTPPVGGSSRSSHDDPRGILKSLAHLRNQLDRLDRFGRISKKRDEAGNREIDRQLRILQRMSR